MATGSRTGVRPCVAGARDRGDPGLLARQSCADAERGGTLTGLHPRDLPADPAHAREARPRALRRALVLADAAGADARLGLSGVAQPVGARPAVDGGPRREDERVVLGGDPRPPGHRLRRPRTDDPDHDDRARRRGPLAGARHVDGARAARRAPRRRARASFSPRRRSSGSPSTRSPTPTSCGPSWRRSVSRAGLSTTRRSSSACARSRRLSTGLLAERSPRSTSRLRRIASRSRVPSRILPALLETAGLISAGAGHARRETGRSEPQPGSAASLRRSRLTPCDGRESPVHLSHDCARGELPTCLSYERPSPRTTILPEEERNWTSFGCLRCPHSHASRPVAVRQSREAHPT